MDTKAHFNVTKKKNILSFKWFLTNENIIKDINIFQFQSYTLSLEKT